MRRLLCLAVFFLYSACAARPLVGPGGSPYHTFSDEATRLEFYLPEKWTFSSFPTPRPNLSLVSPSGAVTIRIERLPDEMRAADLLRVIAESKRASEDLATVKMTEATGTVLGQEARGWHFAEGESRVTMFVVEQGRRTYVVILMSAIEATHSELEIADFIMAHLRLVGE